MAQDVDVAVVAPHLKVPVPWVKPPVEDFGDLHPPRAENEGARGFVGPVARVALDRDPQVLASLTHTPSPMDFLRSILGRPSNERPFLLIPVGYPVSGVTVPDIARKAPDLFIEWR